MLLFAFFLFLLRPAQLALRSSGMRVKRIADPGMWDRITFPNILPFELE